MLALLAAATAVNPYQLEIGLPGRVVPKMGWTNLATGRASSAKEIAVAARGFRFVLAGESHDNPHHHEQQAAIVQALVDDGREVVVGFEMFTRDNQASLNPWTLGWWTEEEFIAGSNWQKQWGFPYAIYRPIFEVVRKNRLPMAALNLPRDWVRRIGREGPGALTPEERKWAPSIDTNTPLHRKVFEALIGGHPLQGQRGENMYAAQVSWDEGMAQSAVEFMDGRASRRAVMVIICGSGHSMYGQGINLRLARRGIASLHAMGIEETAAKQGVSRGIADFLYVSPDVARPDSR